MRKYFQTLSLLCIIICNTALGQPKIKIINPDINFGNVKYSERSVVAAVRITNIGTDTLRITGIKSDCGCTVADMPKRDIAPGDTSQIVATMYLDNLTGQVVKYININSNDTSVVISRINLTAVVIRPFETTPKYLTFKRVIVGKSATAEVTIENNSNTDAVVKSVSFSGEGISCNLKEDDVIKKGETFKLIATASPTKAGSIRNELTIELYHPEEKSISVLIYGNAVEE